jgi:hypothetical protein
MAKDILLKQDGDLWIENGDFKVGISEEQDIARIVEALPGHFRNNPIIGFGFAKRIKNLASPESIRKGIDTHLQLDGFREVLVEFQGNKVSNIIGKRDE